MSGRVKVKAKNVQDPELTIMFQQMVDPEQADSEVVFPKYLTVRQKISAVARFLETLATGPIAEAAPDIDMSEILDKAHAMRDQLVEHQYTKDEISTKWHSFKDTMPVQECIMICSYLSPYKADLQDKDNLSGRWITRMTLGTHVFPDMEFDLYLLWNRDNIFNSEQLKKYILTLFSMLYRTTHDIYQITTSPDIDIDKFSVILIDAIKRVQQQPELSRCGMAFRKISESVEMLKDNFSGYYKDFIQSKNPSTIIESFVLDVAENQQGSAELTRQFRKIISYYRKISQQNRMNNPDVKKLFNVLEGRISALEKNDRRTGRADDNEEGDGSGEAYTNDDSDADE